MSTRQIVKQKSGGPYTKAQQEKRRMQVYEMHFEKGYPAVKIASELGINRNTINDDITYWYSQIAMQLGEGNLGAVLLKQIERIEIQRMRLLDDLDKQTDFEKRYRLEKLLFEVDQKIIAFVSKMVNTKILGKFVITEEISEDEISELVRSVAFSCGRLYPESISKERILEGIISVKKCDIEYAENVVKKMKSLGLELFYDTTTSTFDKSYDLLSFGVTRGFIKQKEKDAFLEKREEDDKKDKQYYDEIEKKYEKMFGSDKSKWSKEAYDKMHDEMFE